MSGNPEEASRALRDFSLPFGADLPPLPGAEARTEGRSPLLARRLWTLLAEAGGNRIPAPVQKPDLSLVDEMQAIEEAASLFHVSQSLTLDRVLWTRSGPFWRGEVAARLAQFPDEEPPAFVMLLARAMTRRAALLGHAQPFVVSEEITGPLDVPGPFLVLVACTLAPTGRAEALRGHAQPVLNGQQLFPVETVFQRDVLTSLVALQRTVDCHGLDAAIERPFDTSEERFARYIELALSREGTPLRTLRIDILEDDRPQSAKTNAEAEQFSVSPERFADGSFVTWLQQAVSRAAASPEAPLKDD